MSAVNTKACFAVTAGALAALAAGLAACGTTGDLERPGPIYGAAAKRQYQEDVAAGRTSGTSDVDAASQRRVNPPTTTASGASSTEDAPRTKRDIQDPAQKLTPLSAAPVDGPPNPLGPPVSTRPPG